MKATFSTQSLLFRLASVYSNFPKDPEGWRQGMIERDQQRDQQNNERIFPEDKPSTYWTNYAQQEVLNICHYRWCVIKGAVKAIVGALLGALSAALVLGYPLAYVAAMLTVGTMFEIPAAVVPGLVIIAIVLSLIFAFLVQEYEVLPRTFRWLRTVIFGKKPDYKVHKPSRIKQEFNAMYDSLKNKYCVPIEFTDDK